jgi:hypothetical protein
MTDPVSQLQLSVGQGAEQVLPRRGRGPSQRRLSNLGHPESKARKFGAGTGRQTDVLSTPPAGDIIP